MPGVGREGDALRRAAAGGGVLARVADEAERAEVTQDRRDRGGREPGGLGEVAARRARVGRPAAGRGAAGGGAAGAGAAAALG